MRVDDVRFGAEGLVPVVVQHAHTGDVLTLAYADREALERTLATHSTWLYSRSRAALWHKGETSGNTQRVVAIDLDCDADAVRYLVVPSGPACHTGRSSCFPTVERPPFEAAIAHLRATIVARRDAAPETSYTAALLNGGVDRIAKKIGEEATEVVIAAKNGDPSELAWEVADLLYHTLVLLEERGVSLDDVGAELLRRAH